ncbi:uncharacterized protein LOC100837110 [Brachypodium distachyon]|uniref:F-box domain-containing protein n=1 Tax=Brachypodium distachyon TaxID=15368 RepID=I1GMB8_BRADI|nr:uncharacterized protein LOC100837110 [Brachypodium distachyon]KQK12766.1 hypothetical protein BRADI_1g05810v3 [Brachypodium distachyon]|eukprot:XP_003557657.1 uncharacterized protein LOC100837110 [Brachypodium distachyon]
MAMGTSPQLYRRLRKASDISIVTTAFSSSKRMHMSKEYISCCEDKISSLPDEILIMILEKLDARTTLTTTILSKRWLDLPRRSHTCYDLSVHEILPPRYHRIKKKTMETKAGYEAEKKAQNLTDIYAFKDKYERYHAIRDRHERWMGKVHLLTSILQRYERRAMRCYVKRVNAFLLAPDSVQQRSIQKLRLQMFEASSFIDQWIMAAIGRWGVEDLELVIENSSWCYDFRLLDGCQNVRLKRLVLSGCYHHSATNSLVLQGLTTLTLCKTSSTMLHAYDILRNCVQLIDLRLEECSYDRGAFHINVPASKLKNLQLDNCNIGKIYLTLLPCLETFACRGQPAKIYYGVVPRLKHVSLDFMPTGDHGEDDSSGSNWTYPLSKFFKGLPPPLDYLVLQMRGRQMWIEPTIIPGQFNHLKKLFIANMPMNWDTFWILILLGAAPALESLHVHIDKSAEMANAGSLDVKVEHRQHHHLKELVVIGFEGVGWQTSFVKQIMGMSPRLMCVHLFDGRVVENKERGLWGLEIDPHQREWHECDRSEVLDDLRDGSSLPYLEIVLE